MQINNIKVSQSFGKTPVMKCSVKSAETGKKEYATLYQMDPRNGGDYNEVKSSKNTRDIFFDFEQDYFNRSSLKQYYLLKNDKTQEVIGCAETTKRMTGGVSGGRYLQIEEISENQKYKNGIEPIFAYLVHFAKDVGQDAVVSISGENVIPNMHKAKQVQIKTGEIITPYANFDEILNHAEKRYNIEYTV